MEMSDQLYSPATLQLEKEHRKGPDYPVTSRLSECQNALEK